MATFTVILTVLEAVSGVPAWYVPLTTALAQLKAKVPPVTVVTWKLQLEDPAVTGMVTEPAVPEGVPEPVRTTGCTPMERKAPLPLKVIPLVAVVAILYVPMVVTLTESVTALLPFRAVPMI